VNTALDGYRQVAKSKSLAFSHSPKECQTIRSQQIYHINDLFSVISMLDIVIYETACGGFALATWKISVVRTFLSLLCCQGCQMVYFHTENPYLGKLWIALEWNMLVYFISIWNILRPFGIFCAHLEYFTPIWYIL
jgi:hypothetical protein